MLLFSRSRSVQSQVFNFVIYNRILLIFLKTVTENCDSSLVHFDSAKMWQEKNYIRYLAIYFRL